MNDRLVSSKFPRSSAYHPDWVLAGVSGGANALWITEWLTQALQLEPGMRVLDLGCGRASSSIFLRREFKVEVWATDLWFHASDNLKRIRDAGEALRTDNLLRLPTWDEHACGSCDLVGLCREQPRH